MGSFLATVANSLWLASAAADAARFQRALVRPAVAQATVLQRIVQVNASCEFGRQHDFAQMQSVADFQRQVASATYDDYAPAIARMAAGEGNVLTSAPVRLFEPSSGSTAASKLVPYTAALQREFQAGLAAWISNLYRRHPHLLAGPAYWSVTPLTAGLRTTPGGIPIGFAEDSDYLGPLGKWVGAALAVPNGIKQVAEIDAFRYATLRWLLATGDLRLVSVWNPTFLTLLLDALVAWWEPLLADLAAGTLTLPGPRHSVVTAKLAAGLRPYPARARTLAQIDPHAPAALQKIWPRLGLISAWADGSSASYAEALQARLPHVPLQAKGLLATEAIVSLPWVNAPGHILALTSHFLEFIEESGAVRLAHELTVGQCYTVMVTTGGGLYRYQLHDLVEVVGRVQAAPCIRFVGKTDHIADWFGEKLNERFVATCLEELFTQAQITPRFALLAPAEIVGGVAYTLYVEAEGALAESASHLARRLDDMLRHNFHYDYCRRLGQLLPVRVVQVEQGAATYLTVLQARGMKLGNIKPAVLDKQSGWDAAFHSIGSG